MNAMRTSVVMMRMVYKSIMCTNGISLIVSKNDLRDVTNLSKEG